VAIDEWREQKKYHMGLVGVTIEFTPSFTSSWSPGRATLEGRGGATGHAIDDLFRSLVAKIADFGEFLLRGVMAASANIGELFSEG